MTLEQMIADTIEVANYLREQFGKEKIYIMGHSWGMLLGVLTVKQKPELFHAYIGVGQVAKQEKSERLAYTYMKEQFSKVHDDKMLRKLNKFTIETDETIPLDYLLGVRSEGMNQLGIGVMRSMASMHDLVLTILQYKGYTLGEKVKFAKGSLLSLKYLNKILMKTDLIKEVSDLEVPIYIFQGKYDYQASYLIAREFITSLKAPIKGFYTFEHSAHSPNYEESDKMCEIIKVDVLHNQVSMADVQ